MAIEMIDIIRTTATVDKLLEGVWKTDPEQGKYFVHHIEHGYIMETRFWDYMDEKAEDGTLPKWAGEAYIITQNQYLTAIHIAMYIEEHGEDGLQEWLLKEARKMYENGLAERIVFATRGDDGKIRDDR